MTKRSKAKAEIRALVAVRCVSCKAKRIITAGEVGADDHPMCGQCGMPMVAVKASTR
jgi:hypothetical protein